MVPCGGRITVSAACIIAKHSDPLSGVINRVQKLLKATAKKRYGRDAFAVYRTTAGLISGTRFRHQGQWLLPLLREIESAMREEHLSPRAVYILDTLRPGLSNWPDQDIANLHTARRKVIEYQIKRQSGSNAALADKAVRLYDALADWTSERARSKDKATIDAFEEFLNLLALVRFLTRHGS